MTSTKARSHGATFTFSKYDLSDFLCKSTSVFPCFFPTNLVDRDSLPDKELAQSKKELKREK
jgi:hypothetical protein